MMKKQRLILLLCFMVSGSIFAQAGKKVAKEPIKEVPITVDTTGSTQENNQSQPVNENLPKYFFIRINNVTVNSATAANSLKMDSIFQLNRLANNRTVLSVPAIGEYKGKNVEFGIGSSHSPFFKSNFLLSIGNYADSSPSTNYYYDQSIVSLTTTSNLTVTSNYLYQYSNNTLKTGRISYGAEFFPLAKSSPALAKLGFRFGPELYTNGSKMHANSLLSNAPSILDLIRTRDIKSSEIFTNLFIGLSYSFEINPKNQVDFGVDYFKSIASKGTFDDSSLTFLSLNPPITMKFTSSGSFKTNLTGYRLNVGYKYQISEKLGIRLSYGYWDATHEVTSSKIKDGMNSSSLFSSLSSRNNLGYIIGGLDGFGPNPSSSDKRSQVGFEIILFL